MASSCFQKCADESASQYKRITPENDQQNLRQRNQKEVERSHQKETGRVLHEVWNE